MRKRLRSLGPPPPFVRGLVESIGKLADRLGRIPLALLGAAIVALLGYSVVGGGPGDGAAEPPAGVSERSLQSATKLKLADKVGQVLMVPPGALKAATPGAVFIGNADWPGAAAGTGLINRLTRDAEGTPPLIATRQEGGAFRSLSDLPSTLSQEDVAERANPADAESVAQKTGRALRDAGFHLNLAPIADVAPLTSPIADRAFGDETALVADLVAASIRGCKTAGIACAPAHFPGLGGASSDTGAGPATVSLDAASLELRDLPPFQAAFKAGAEATVVSLSFYAAYDPVTPGALTPQITGDLLRKTAGFKGVAITDDLSSGAVSATEGAPQAAVTALAAGVDLVFVSDPGQAGKVYESVLSAAQAGLIAPERLDAAVARVLELKRKLGVQ